MKKNYQTIIRELREDHDLKQKDIAKILNRSQQGYAHIENNNAKLQIEDLIILCKVYNVSADYILGLIDHPRPLYNKPNREQIKNQQIIKNSKHFTINNN